MHSRPAVRPRYVSLDMWRMRRSAPPCWCRVVHGGGLSLFTVAHNSGTEVSGAIFNEPAPSLDNVIYTCGSYPPQDKGNVLFYQYTIFLLCVVFNTIYWLYHRFPKLKCLQSSHGEMSRGGVKFTWSLSFSKCVFCRRLSCVCPFGLFVGIQACAAGEYCVRFPRLNFSL